MLATELFLEEEGIAAHAEAEHEEAEADKDEEFPVDAVPLGAGPDGVRQADGVEQALAANPDKVEEYRAGKTKLIGFFVGQVMKASQGKANPGMVNQLLDKKING